MPLLCVDTPRHAWPQALLATAPQAAHVSFFFVLASLGLVLLLYRFRGYKQIVLATDRAHYACTLIARMYGYRVYWIGSPRHSAKQTLLSFLARVGVTRILCPNQHIQAGYLRMNIAGNKTYLWYPTRALPETTQEKRHGITIGCDGIYTMDAGMGSFLKAVALAQDILGRICVRIGGAIADQRGIAWLAKNLGLEKSLQIIPSDAPQWVQACDIYVLPGGTHAPLPVSIISAQMAGCAIIATNTIGHKEFVQERLTGMLIESGNADMLSQALITLSRDSALRAAFAKESRTFAQAVYTPPAWDAIS